MLLAGVLPVHIIYLGWKCSIDKAKYFAEIVLHRAVLKVGLGRERLYCIKNPSVIRTSVVSQVSPKKRLAFRFMTVQEPQICNKDDIQLLLYTRKFQKCQQIQPQSRGPSNPRKNGKSQDAYISKSPLTDRGTTPQDDPSLGASNEDDYHHLSTPVFHAL